MPSYNDVYNEISEQQNDKQGKQMLFQDYEILEVKFNLPRISQVI